MPLLIILLLTGDPAQANQGTNGDQDFTKEIRSESDNHAAPFVDQNELWVVPEGWDLQNQAPSVELSHASQPDDYGYTWDDTIPVDWVDATGAVNTGMRGSSAGQYVGPVDLDFSFPYYENTYSQVNISASGFLTFTEADTWPSQSQIPTSSEPNNVIAPYWAPLFLSETGPAGQVFYLQGGEAPERFFVVEWAGVAGGEPEGSIGGNDHFHFQVILYENGDIRFQYHQMIYEGNSYCGAAGIEDSNGEDGLNYLPFCAIAPSNRAVLFSRPAPAARARLSPQYQSSFISPGESVSFPVLINNLGDLGEDTFELSADASWAFGFFASDGVTPLSDTNDDGSIDTGSLTPGQTREIIVKVTASADIPIGAGDQITITATSSINPDRSAVTTLQVAVPARFAQAFRDNADGAMGLFLAQPDDIKINKATNDAWWGYNPAIAEIDVGGFVYFWQRWRYSEYSQNFNAELEFVFLNYAGNALKPVTRLTDHSSTTLSTYDEEPVVTVAPNGTIGVAWRRRIYRQSVDGMQENWNIYFATLNNEGHVKFGPINLTQNDGWYQTNPVTYEVPRFWNVHLATNDENNFALTWRRESYEAPSQRCSSECKLDDIYFALLTSQGAPVVAPTRVTTDTLGMSEGYFTPTVQQLSNNRWLLVYDHNPGGLAISVLDNQGNLVLNRSFIGNRGWSPVAKHLVNSDSILIAWTAWSVNNPQIHLIILDANTYQRRFGPNTLINPAASTGGDFASLAADSNGRTILSWMDFNAKDRRHLYYALLDETGSILTPPMVFHSAETDTNGQLHIEAGFSGNSIATNRQFMDVPITYWAAGWIERLYDAGVSSGCQLTPPQYCPDDFVKRSEMAVFLERGLRGADFKPPAASGEVFEDVPAGAFAASWIELLYADGITAGCGGGNYCPEQAVTRAQMAIFLLRAKYYPEDYTPPPVGDSTGFSDVAPDDFAAAWIKQLAAEGITAGCGGGNFCPDQSVTRAQMAAFLVRTFDLP